MESDQAIDMARQAVMLTLTVGAPVLAVALVVGLIVGTAQALTQIQDHALSTVPKIAAVLIVAVMAGPWMVARLVDFAREMFASLP